MSTKRFKAIKNLKIILCFGLTVFLLLCCGCKEIKNDSPTKTNEKIYGVWVSYSEVNELLSGDRLKQNFKALTDTCQSAKITDIFIAVRPFCDSLYKSDYFPQNELSKMYDFDVFSYMIDEAHGKNLKIHAWINPYRVASSGNDINSLKKDSPAYIWATDGMHAKNVCIQNGIYLNPASEDVKRLITDGIREIIYNYDVDGIHFDDYFYPTASADFDKESFEEYTAQNENPLSLEDFRKSNVNSLISAVYTTVKFKSKNLVFSISPAASLQKCENEYFADIKLWCRNDCVDIIIPQLYFGFDYPDDNFKFGNLLSEWKKVVKDTETRLCIGLATYKIGTDAEPDKTEWQNGKEIIKKQTEICQNDKAISGAVYFSYTSLCEYLK